MVMPAKGPNRSPSDADVFSGDDYVEIFQTYFAEIVREKSWEALPAGWHNPHSAAAESFSPLTLTSVQLQRYALDEAYALEDTKSDIVALVSSWERKAIQYAELTLCPSVSGANLAVMAALASLGFHHVIFETPTYFASLDQAKMLGMGHTRIPSYRANEFEADLGVFEVAVRENEPCCLWLTQPKFGLGSNQNLDRVSALGRILGPSNVMVLDEAAEQLFPSTLSALGDLSCPLVRTRGILKGIGLNGLRIAFVLHPAEWRQAFEDVLEPTGNSLDRFSLTNAGALARDERLFSTLLKAANEQVLASQKAADLICVGTPVRPARLVNGYMSTFFVDLAQLRGSYEEKRTALLTACQKRRMPVVLKASVGFARDETWEGVRINYFTTLENVTKSAEILIEAFRDVETLYY